MSLITDILGLYQARGSIAYFGERVSVTEHGLQAAHFGQVAQAPETLVVAALLHDVGHLLEALPDAIEDWVQDAHHEVAGARWLARHFDPAVSEPVRLHVAAKRYLCATDPSYFARLSPASVHTLQLQGGPMSTGEVARFEAEQFAQQAVQLRHWDDQGKVEGLRTPALSDYMPLIGRIARRT